MIEMEQEKAEKRELELTPNARLVLEKRYLMKDKDRKVVEEAADMFRRVADNIALAEKGYPTAEKYREIASRFYDMMTSLEFMPNSPTLMNAGRELQQLSACFVLPIEDSIDSIFQTIKETALIHKSGGGTGFSFSRIRPKNDVVKSTKGVSSGPVSFMNSFNAATETIKQGGTRRGANMGILRVDHPDIMEFITCKADNDALNNFNISVAVTDDFMRAVVEDDDYDLINPNTKNPGGSLNAAEVFNKMVEMAWRNGEPGIIFLDALNRGNPTPHIGMIESTNPCGEQPLLPYESCNLGSINLAKHVQYVEAKPSIDWEKLRENVWMAVRFLDNVIDENEFPLEKIRAETMANRKIGLGIMGWADLLYNLGIPYCSDEALDLGGEVMSLIDTESKEASRELARERGQFPNFAGSVYDDAGDPAIRNATTTTIAPTGTISIIAGCSSGIEPAFALVYKRANVLDNDEMIEINPVFERVAKDMGFYSEELMALVAEHGSIHDIETIPESVRKVFVTAHDITPEWHVKMQAAFQAHVDNAVSKTVNFANSATVNDVANVYRMAYDLKCKGITIYRDGSRDLQVLSIAKKEKEDKTGTPPEHKIKRRRPEVTRGTTTKIQTGCGNLYVTINEDESGPCELFSQLGKTGGCIASQTEAISRLISLALKFGVPIKNVREQLRNIRCPQPSWSNGSTVYSCADGIGLAIDGYVKEREERKSPALFDMDEAGAPPPVDEEQEEKFKMTKRLADICPQCPDCSGMLEFKEGCVTCGACGYTKC
jgi:ribonucleoside-diphosphate reductase alpha chain